MKTADGKTTTYKEEKTEGGSGGGCMGGSFPSVSYGERKKEREERESERGRERKREVITALGGLGLEKFPINQQ